MTTFFSLTQATHNWLNLVQLVISKVPSPNISSLLMRRDIPVGLQNDKTLPILSGTGVSPIKNCSPSAVYLNSGGMVKVQCLGTGGTACRTSRQAQPSDAHFGREDEGFQQLCQSPWRQAAWSSTGQDHYHGSVRRSNCLLLVVDSLSHNSNISKIEVVTNTTIKNAVN